LGTVKLSEMKKDLNDLLEISDEIVDEQFSDDASWVHVDYEVDPKCDKYSQAHDNSKAAGDNLRKSVKRIFGHAGKILIKFGYASAQKAYSSHHHAEWLEEANSSIVYGYGYSYPDNIESLIREYSEGIKTLHKFFEEITTLEESLDKQEASDMWDQA